MTVSQPREGRGKAPAGVVSGEWVICVKKLVIRETEEAFCFYWTYNELHLTRKTVF